jgi:hypothetical protein
MDNIGFPALLVLAANMALTMAAQTYWKSSKRV